MSLIVEDGSIITGANSYASVLTINDYHSLRSNTTWTGTDGVKESAILRAMVYIESLCWRGVKANRTQPLEWPRGYVVDRDGYAIDSNIIPIQVVHALAEAALRELVTSGSTMADESRDDVLTSLEVAGAVKMAWSGTAPTKTEYPIIKAILRGLISPSGGARLVR